MIKRQTYISTKVLYSLDIPKIDYTTDYDKVCVSLYRNSGKYDNLYSGELLPYDGKVSLYDMKQLIEQFMLDKGLSYCEFGLDVENEGGEEVDITILKVLYCRVKPTTNVEHFVEYNFLSTVKVKEVDYDRVYEDELLYYAEKGEDVSLTLTYVYSTAEGELKTKEVVYTETAGVAGIDSIYFDFYEVWLDVGGESGAILHCVQCKVGERCFTYYIRAEAPDLVCSFYNAFNIREVLALYGKTSTKMKTQKSEAVCGGITAYYDVSNEVLYEFESVRLSPEMMKLVMDFLTSPEVLLNWSNSARILITDYTYEYADDDKEKYIVKFTWKYADNRMTFERPYGINSRTFTEQFDKTFK